MQVKKMAEEVKRLLILVYVNKELTDEGVKSFYKNVSLIVASLHKKGGSGGVKSIEYNRRIPGNGTIKHCSITDIANNKMKNYLKYDSEFNNFDKNDLDITHPMQKIKNKDISTPKQVVLNDYQNYKISKFVKEKKMMEDKRYLNIIYWCC